MRLVAIHPARDPIACGPGPVHVGSASDDTVTFAGPGVAPDHLTLVADARGLVLTVRPRCQRVYVNARLVRERALLRYGDAVTLGANRFLVTSDAPPPEASPDPVDPGVGRVALRVVSGLASGRIFAAERELRLGAGTGNFEDLAEPCRIVRVADGLVLASEDHGTCVNGWRCQRARLAPGDQIVLGEHRLIVEAPGLEYAAHVPEAPPAPAPALRAVAETSSTGVWWLIVAAALLAAVIAMFLYFRW